MTGTQPMHPARTHLVVALAGFALGTATALLGVWFLGTPRTVERVVEVEKVVERIVEKPAAPRRPNPVAPTWS